MNNKYNIVLSVAAMDEAFSAMRDKLAEKANVTVVGLNDFSLADADIFIGKRLDARALADAHRLKAVFAYKTGVDDFPVKALAEKGVVLCNSHVNSRYIAEYAFSLAAALVGRIVRFDRAMRKGDWLLDDPYWQSIFEMRVGLVGYGGIGRAVRDILESNGIPAYTLDRGKNYAGVTAVSSLEELCAACDLLILSLPQTPETDDMFDSRIFGMLRGKFIVNVGRYNCINERALYAALTADGGLAGAALDTWREKQRDKNIPLKPFDMPFDALDNVILSSHKAMQVKTGHRRYVEDTLRNVLRFIGGESPLNAVDLKAGY